MPTIDRINALDNERFRLWDYGTATYASATPPAHGYICNRFKGVIDGAPGVTVSQGSTSSSTDIPKWLRAVPCLQVAVPATVNAKTDRFRIRQVIEDGQAFGRSNVVIIVYVMGTAGRHFYVGVAGQYQRFTALGNDVVLRVEAKFTIPDQALTTLDVDIFEAASAGTFYIPFAQATVGRNDGRADVIEMHMTVDNMVRCSRYARPIPQGTPFKAVSATRVIGAVQHPVQMRAQPTLQNPPAAVNLTKLSDASTVTASAATVSVTNASSRSARVIIDGFTGLTVGDEFILSTQTLGVLHADF